MAGHPHGGGTVLAQCEAAHGRIAQLRKLTGLPWGLEEPQLRTIANGYVRARRGAMEFAAAAWLPATSKLHVELLEREMPRQHPKVLTTPLLAEASLVLVCVRREELAVRLVFVATSQRREDPLHAVAEGKTPRRPLTTTG